MDDANAIVSKEVESSTQKTGSKAGLSPEKAEPGADKKVKKCHSKQHQKEKRRSLKRTSKKKAKDTSDDSDSDSTTDSDTMSSASDTSDSESDDRAARRRRKRALPKTNRHSKKRQQSSSEESESEDDDESPPPKRSHKKRSRRAKAAASEDDTAPGEEEEETAPTTQFQIENLEELRRQIDALAVTTTPEARKAKIGTASRRKSKKMLEKSRIKKASSYKRVDQLWDTTIHNFKLKETTQDDDSEFAEYAFNVRRRFDFEGQYLFTAVDVKSKELKKALAEVLKDCKSISLDAEEPTLDPNLLFLYVEQIRKYYKKTLKKQIKKERKKKTIKQLEIQRTLCKTLVKYIDEDYAETKKTLYPLLAAGNISFDLTWALFKPGEVVVTSTYGVWDEPRCFKIDHANKLSSLTRGEYYSLEGKYMEYDGKSFGMGDFEMDIDAFKGVRKISSLAAYPLKYHRNEAAVRKQIIERGTRFVECDGMNYRLHKGLAFMKKKKQVLKINVNGRVMIDPATFRRINANYPVSILKTKDSDILFSDLSDDCSCDSDYDSDDVGTTEHLEQRASDNDEPKVKFEFVLGEDGKLTKNAVEVDEDGNRIRSQKIEQLENVVKQSFTEEELLLTSSVVLGFAFSEKLWLEFTLSGVKEIEYNEGAFDSLVLPTNQKSIVKALVESHKFHAAKTIDDVVQGKGRSLVAVLHGPPGTGKTLTAESISELLKCPLYMVSAGELGTDPARLELELQRIMDVAHCWGAILLLDEADVFLEKRETHDVHRNALVSIFLRVLEYFQGILFLTTNRVETFDEAFQSRIHVALKYGELSIKARAAVWKTFFDLCRKQEACTVVDMSEHDINMLARHTLNGRQIKNIVRTAQALALNENETLGLAHVKRVLDVAESFQRDLRGGTGYDDAMRSYT